MSYFCEFYFELTKYECFGISWLSINLLPSNFGMLLSCPVIMIILSHASCVKNRTTVICFKIDFTSRDGCSRQSNRILRGLTKRPIFLDPHIEALHAVKGIVAKGIPNGSSAKATVSIRYSILYNRLSISFSYLSKLKFQHKNNYPNLFLIVSSCNANV